uniref:hypothetical chloroplast RF19 n=1 Tax=Shivparvatia glanduligera TaxID=1701025 RepID=UPI0022FD8D34|nr:hypothetical chloroplast RF19 [Shivparvatia glanduligera]WAM61344.1 hypothetical chloroplast RF19 [Shivparvatia glanduligera]
MIFQSFLLGNLLSLCMKIINSVVVVGLYYGFLTTFSIGPSYLFLLRAQVMEEGEEGTEKKVSATTGFIMGQLMMFISIYYTPLHLALGRPHTITVLALPYLLFHFFWNNHKNFFFFGSTSRNSMRNLSIQCVFLNNLIFQLFNHFILPSSMLARLVNIYMFRCNNKILFVTSSFVGWLIGHILFMKWVGLVLVWIQQNHSIRSNVLIRSNKYLVSELKNSMARIFSILFFITCVYYLGRMPSPIFTKKLKENSERKEIEEEIDVEIDVEIEKTSETKETKQEEEGFTEEDPPPSLFSDEKEDPDKMDETEKIRVNGKDKTKDEFNLHLKEACYKNSPTYYSGNQDISKLEILKEEKKNLFWFEKPLLSLLFDYKRWNRPTRYIKNNRFENAVRKEMSQYFFYTCKNDGKQRISFTYPPSLSIFWEMIQRKISLSTTEKFLNDELYNYWIYNNEQKKNSLSNEFANRIAVLDKGLFYIDGLDKKTRLCNEKTKKEYLPKIKDPFLNGSYRGIIKKGFSPSIINETAVKNRIDVIFINKIHSILSNDYNYHEFEQKKDAFNKKSISKEIRHFMQLMSQFYGESTFNLKGISLLPEDQEKFCHFLVDAIIGLKINKKLIKKSIGIKDISKKVPRWSYNLIDDLEQQERIKEDDVPRDHQIRSRKSKRVILFYNNEDNLKINQIEPKKFNKEVALIRYSQQSDFRRNIIKGSMRVQRRKIVFFDFFQANSHSPLFLDRIDKSSFSSINISKLIKKIFRNYIGKTREFQISDYTEEKKKEYKRDEEKRKEKTRRKIVKEQIQIKIAETWDTIRFGQVIRGLLLVTHSTFRKYFLLPFFIIAKNMGRIVLFQLPEWSEDFKEWNKEIHVKCTYNGAQLSETEFPKNWLKEGIQIKILFPFYIKPWHRSKLRPFFQEQMKKQNQKDSFCFLTVWGLETEFPFGPSRKGPSFFKPIYKELKKRFKKFTRKLFQVLKNVVIKEKIEFFLKVPIIKSLLFLKKIKKNFSMVNQPFVFGLGEESRKIKKEKDLTIKNHMVHESSIQTQLINWINYSDSVIEQKTQNLANRTRTIKNQIEKEKKNGFQTIKFIIKHKRISYGTQNLESSQNLGQILKRRNTRLIRKSKELQNFFRERIFVDIFIYIINISRINIKLLLESTKHFSEKPVDNNNKKQERVEKKNFFQFIKPLFFVISHIHKNSKFLSDLSFLSQAYIFFKLLEAEFINLYKFKLSSVLQYRGTQRRIPSKLKIKKRQNSGLNPWKNWLIFKNNYQYDLSQINWFQFGPKNWRNQVTKFFEIENKNYQKIKRYSYKKNELYLLNYKNTKNSEKRLFFLLDQKKNFKKTYRYNTFSYNFIFYEDKKDSYSYGEPLQVNKKQEFSYIYNYNIVKDKFIYMWWSIPITNRLGIKFLDIETNTDRKFCDWKIIHFFLKNKIDIETWINISKGNPFTTSIISNEKKYLELENRNQDEKELISQRDRVSDIQKNYESLSSNHQKDIQENYIESYIKKSRKKKQDKSSPETELHLFFKRFLFFQLKWDNSLNQKLITNIKVYSLLLRLKNPGEITISSVERREIRLNIMPIQKDLTFTQLIKGGILFFEPMRLSVKGDGEFIRYQTIVISFIHKNKHQNNQNIDNIDKRTPDEWITRYQTVMKTRDKSYFDLLVPAKIFSSRRRKELRILICLNSSNNNGTYRNTVSYNGNPKKNCSQFCDENNQKLNVFLWPNYQLEDLAGINRYWFNTNNGSRFSILRIHMYPRLKMYL